MFIIEDTNHAWRSRLFATLPDAIKELQQLARVRWNEEPNRAPCKQWRTCGPLYQLLEVEYGPPSTQTHPIDRSSADQRE